MTIALSSRASLLRRSGRPVAIALALGRRRLGYEGWKRGNLAVPTCPLNICNKAKCLPYLLAVLFYLPPSTSYLPFCSAAPLLPHVAWWSESVGVSHAPLLRTDAAGNSFLLAPVLARGNPGKEAFLLYYSVRSQSPASGRASPQPGTTLPAEASPSLLWRFSAPVWGLPALADVNGDSLPDIFLATLDGRLICLSTAPDIQPGEARASQRAEGKPTWEVGDRGPFYSSPALSDLDGDGTIELIVGGRDHLVHCLDAATGNTKWLFLTGAEIDSSPAIANLLGDDALEVVIGSDDGFVYCLSGKDGTLLWRFRANWWVSSSPTLADLEGNGSLEVLVGDSSGTLHCLNGATGEMLWSYPTLQPIVSEASSADLDGDGRKEVFFGSDALYRLDSSGSLVWRFAPGEHFSAAPLLLSGEGGGSVIIPGNSLYCLDAHTGNPLWQRSLSSRGLFDASAALDKSGNLLLSLSTGHGELLLLRSRAGSEVTSLPWPKPRANLLNTGSAP